MPFSKQQTDELSKPLSRGDVKTRKQGWGSVSYIESWHAISEANRIFGFDAWSSDTIETRCIVEKERMIGGKDPNKPPEPGWGVSYNAKVRIGVYFDDGSNVYRDGCGTGHGIDKDLGQAHESAIKEAESDAQKRALRMFGNVFGLALYDKTQANVADEPDIADRYYVDCRKRILAFPDNSTMALTWWQDAAQQQARRNAGLSQEVVDLLKDLVKAKLPKREEQTDG